MFTNRKNNPKTGKKGVFKRIYQIVNRIPKGKVMTYGQIAKKMGNSRLAQVVGWALHANPDPKRIPCHRVVNKEGKLACNFAIGGWQEQKKRLSEEKIIFKKEKTIDLSKYLWKKV